MSRFMSARMKEMDVYVPGEQPKAGSTAYIKLNTNEFPFEPSPSVKKILSEMPPESLRLYPDPTGHNLKTSIADFCSNTYKIRINSENVFLGNGSDEVLSCSFRAFFDEGDKVRFPDITYGFYKVYGALYGLDIKEIALKDDYTIDISDYTNENSGGHIFIANPNAPTGICLTLSEIEYIIKNNPSSLVVVDEAYVDFGGESSIPLIERYDNLLVVQTFSKSRGLAGIRLGMGIGNKSLISSLEKVKYSLNPYNINSLTSKIGEAAIADTEYLHNSVGRIIKTRENFIKNLRRTGYDVLDSKANFVFAKSMKFTGRELYEKLKSNGILVRHFAEKRTEDFIRISIGTEAQMDITIKAMSKF